LFNLWATKISYVHVGLSLIDPKFDHKPLLLSTLVHKLTNLVITLMLSADSCIADLSHSIMPAAWNHIYSALLIFLWTSV